jgi:hypothetical protein
MPLSSVYDSILVAVAGVVNGLGLSFTNAGGQSVTVAAAVLKSPKVEEVDSPLPVIQVAPAAERQRTEPAATEGLVFVTYPVEVSLSAAGNRDFAKNLDVWLNWREQIRLKFQGTTLAGVPQVIDTNTDPDPAFDRQTVTENFDRSKLTVRFRTIEPRGL